MKRLIISLVATVHLFGVYHSEDRQDEFVDSKYFHGKKTGFFVDIGAHGGKIHSNTLYFEQLGWKGVCFEPDPRTFPQLKEVRNCKLYNCAVGSKEGIEKFIQHPCTWTSGLDRTYSDEHRIFCAVPKGEAEKYFIDVEVVTLNRIMREIGVNYIDFLSIDTEGAEMDIISAIDYDELYIHVIVLENKYRRNEIDDFLKQKGFQYVTRLHRDQVYINTRSKGND